MDHHNQSITDTNLDNENVFFKVIKIANSSENREAEWKCTGPSASPCFVPHSISPFLWARHGQRASRRGKATRGGEDFYNLPEERLRNYFLTMHISFKTTKGEDSLKLGIGFGSRSDSCKTITDKFQLGIKIYLLSNEKQGGCKSLPMKKKATPLATGTQADTENLCRISPTVFKINPGAFPEGLGEGISYN